MSDAYYVRNKNCHCTRCRSGGLMAAAILITVGVLALLHQFSGFSFERTFPLLLIVIGLVMLLARTASTEGHRQPYGIPGQQPASATSEQDPWASGRVPPPQLPPSSGQQQDDQQVKP